MFKHDAGAWAALVDISRVSITSPNGLADKKTRMVDARGRFQQFIKDRYLTDGKGSLTETLLSLFGRKQKKKRKPADYGLTETQQQQFYAIARRDGIAAARRAFPDVKGNVNSLMSKLKKQAAQGVFPQVAPRTGKSKKRKPGD